MKIKLMHGSLQQVGCYDSLISKIAVVGEDSVSTNNPIFVSQKKYHSLIMWHYMEISFDRDRRRFAMRWMPIQFVYRYPNPKIEDDIGEAWVRTNEKGLRYLQSVAPPHLVNILKPELVPDKEIPNVAAVSKS